MRLLSLYLPLALYLLFHAMVASPNTAKPKAGAAMDPNGGHSVPTCQSCGATTPGTAPAPIRTAP